MLTADPLVVPQASQADCLVSYYEKCAHLSMNQQAFQVAETIFSGEIDIYFAI